MEVEYILSVKDMIPIDRVMVSFLLEQLKNEGYEGKVSIKSNDTLKVNYGENTISIVLLGIYGASLYYGKNGVPHREDGPAIRYFRYRSYYEIYECCGDAAYYYKGKQCLITDYSYSKFSLYLGSHDYILLEKNKINKNLAYVRFLSKTDIFERYCWFTNGIPTEEGE